MDSHMCVTANGSTIPSTSSVLSQEMLHVDRMDALNQLFLRSHALRKEAMAIDVGRDKPVILVIGDDFIIHYKNRREIVPYMPRLYHDLKTLAHIPCGVENIDAMPVMEDTERREMKQGYLDAIDHILSEGETSPLSSYFDYLTTLQEIIRKNERIEDHLRELSGDLLRLIEAAARCRIDALHETTARVREMIEAKDWDHVAVIILGPQMPREKDVAMLYFQEVLHTSPPSRCPHLQGMMQREVHHQRLIYAESITTEEGALALLKTHMTDEKLGEVILRNSMAMHQDVLGPSAEGYLKSLRLQKL